VASKSGFGQVIENLLTRTVFALIFFHLLTRKPKKTKLFIQTNSFLIFTCPNPDLLATGFEQEG
jgi:hypothetical protein